MKNSKGDIEKLSAMIAGLRASIRGSTDPAWKRPAALRLIDCVLSLNRNYDRFVVPRLNAFETRYPDIRAIAELESLIASFCDPNRFVVEVLDYHDTSRAQTLAGVTQWAYSISGYGSYDDQLSKLEQWARDATPSSYASLHVRGFGLAGYQYLRMLFGADTTKPDKHICAWVRQAVGHSVSPVEALELMEAAASMVQISLRDLDTTIWEKLARSA